MLRPKKLNSKTSIDSTRHKHNIDRDMPNRDILEEAYQTEKAAAEIYGGILPLVEELGDSELYDSLEVVHLDEQRSVEELRMMMKE